jgi:hypothetical protein
MSEPVQTGRRALLKGATGLAGATMGHPVWAQTQVSSAGGTRGPEDQPAVAATWVSTTRCVGAGCGRFRRLSHFVLPGATRLEIEGTADDALAFRNRDRGVVVVARNARSYPQPVAIAAGGTAFTVTLDPDSYTAVAFGGPPVSS